MQEMELQTGIRVKVKERANPILFITFFIWPLLAFILAIRKYQLRESRLIIYFFLIFFGTTFYLGNPAFDSFRLFQELKLVASQPFSEFWIIMSGLYTETRADIVKPLILFSISRFGTSQEMLFGTLAALFGWFYLKGINKVYSDNLINQNINAGLHFFFFLFLNTIFNINGFRFWTATWVFFYGAYNIVLNRDKRFFYVSILSIFFHFSFIFANLILIAYFLIGNNNKAFTALFILSFIVPEIFWSQIQAISGFLGAPIQYKFNVYTNPEYVSRMNEMRQGLKWFMILSGRGTFYYILFMLFFLRNSYEKVINNKKLNNLFSFSLLFITAVNFIRYIPAGGRFINVFYLFTFSYIVGVLSIIKNSKISLTTWIGMIPLSLGLIIKLRVGFEMTSLWLFAPLPFALFSEPYSVYEFITSIF